VTSNGITPGLIYTPLVEDWFKTLARQRGSYDPAVSRDFAVKNVLRQTVGRIGEAKNIAFAVCMIASPLNDFRMEFRRIWLFHDCIGVVSGWQQGRRRSGPAKLRRIADVHSGRAVGAKASEEPKATCGGKPIDAPSNLERRR
jgi:hypothetical protein